jgi:pyridoxal phosphate enzyme (YggS family)
LVAVSKGKSAELIREAATAGVTDFGENYLKEALPKVDELQELALSWHFIGQIQSNKTKPIAENFAWVHSIDRLSIARRLSEQRPYHAPALNVCIQVQLVAEAGKGGALMADTPALAVAIAALPRLKLRGLMCIPPPLEGEADQRAVFKKLRELLLALNAGGMALDTLSMGMSGDFESAIAEGATLVRIGTALFGAR